MREREMPERGEIPTGSENEVRERERERVNDYK